MSRAESSWSGSKSAGPLARRRVGGTGRVDLYGGTDDAFDLGRLMSSSRAKAHRLWPAAKQVLAISSTLGSSVSEWCVATSSHA